MFRGNFCISCSKDKSEQNANCNVIPRMAYFILKFCMHMHHLYNVTCPSENFKSTPHLALFLFFFFFFFLNFQGFGLG